MVELRRIDAATFIGKGKVEEFRQLIECEKPDLVIFDVELSAVQSRNLEKIWKTRVLDRTGLILDIFSQRAKSKEGKLQVELAQYEYLLPRLTRMWTHLSKQRGGGVGLRGPGETQLEVDRRRARERIARLKKNLLRVSKSREIHRQQRLAVPIPTVSLVGYTNAGKSTLFNQIVEASELAEDKLFATLDPKTRRLRLPSGQEILFSDTVGFIRNLPHQLVEAFKSTFEEVAGANLLIHMIDSSHPNYLEQIATVNSVLKELNLDKKPTIEVMNKYDVSHIKKAGSISISAKTGEGIDILLQEISTKLSESLKQVELFVPYSKSKLLNDIYKNCRVISKEDQDEGTLILVSVNEKWFNRLQEFEILKQ